MTTITISKPIGQFLTAAIVANHPSLHMRYILVTDAQKLITTDGFRMHIWPVDAQHEPGFYTWDKAKTLTRVEDEKEIGKAGFYRMGNLYYPQIMHKADTQAPLMIYAADRGVLAPFGIERYPIVKSIGSDMIFMRAITAGEERAICLGINASPLIFAADGSVTSAPLDQAMMLDAQFALEALRCKFVKPCLRWIDPYKPAIIGALDEPHAIIMPVVKRR